MARARVEQQTAAFERVVEVGLTLPGVVLATKYDGAPVLQLNGCFLAGIASHGSAEPHSLVVRMDDESRALLLEDAPATYYVTEYYAKYPLVLARLMHVDDAALLDLLTSSYRLTAQKVPRTRKVTR